MLTGALKAELMYAHTALPREMLPPPSQIAASLPSFYFPSSTRCLSVASDETGLETQDKHGGNTDTSGIYWQSLSKDLGGFESGLIG